MPDDGELNLRNGVLAGDVDEAIDGSVPKLGTDGVECLRSVYGENGCDLSCSGISCCYSNIERKKQ